MSGLVNAIFGGGQSTPPPPDYTPVAQASKEAAEISAQLGREQLAEGRRQYDDNMAVTRPVIDAQLKVMQQGIAQGDDYFQYMKDKQRPVENALNAEAMAAGSTQLQEEKAATAVADVRQGTTSAQNQLLRQGLRYGWSPAKMASAGIGAANGQGLAEATAANSARTTERNLGFAKKMDVAGLYRGLPGASTAAYGVATGAGNSAVSSQMQPGSQLLQTMGQSNNTQMNGRQIALSGLTGVLNSQTGYASSVMQNATAQRGQNMDMIGSIAGLAFSDRRLKTDIEPVAKDSNGIQWYSFRYTGSGMRHVGVMAQEVIKVVPRAVRWVDGFMAVDYSLLQGAPS